MSVSFFDPHYLPPDQEEKKMSRIIYLSGPMTGLPEHNYPAFRRVAAVLRSAGHRVFDPSEYEKLFPFEGEFPVRKAFLEYCRFITQEADTIVMLPDWSKSKGAQAEYWLARSCGCEVWEWEQVSAAKVLGLAA